MLGILWLPLDKQEKNNCEMFQILTLDIKISTEWCSKFPDVVDFSAFFLRFCLFKIWERALS